MLSAVYGKRGEWKCDLRSEGSIARRRLLRWHQLEFVSYDEEMDYSCLSTLTSSSSNQPLNPQVP